MKLTKMAFEINDLKGIFILALFAIPVVASTNINCSGRAFHCVNSTHFMICVDLGGGLSTTIDDFVIPCPATTVCHENNVFECDFPEVTTSPLQVIGVYKQSDISESTSVTTSVTAPTPLSEISSVFKEKNTANIMSIPEDVTPVVKLEVFENIKNPVGVNSDNTTEASFKVTPSFIDSTNEVAHDKQTSNHTITTSAPDNNKNLGPAVENSIHNPVNTSSIDKSKSIDTVTSVIGLINLISTDLPSVVNRKPSSDVLTSLDTLYDNIATTTEQYITKQVTIHGEKVENITEKMIIPTEIIFNERSVTMDVVNTTPVVNTYTTEFIHKIDSGNQTYAVGNSLGKNNNTSKPVPETTTKYLTPIVNNTFTAVGLVDLITRDPKKIAQSTNDYKNTFYGFTAVTTHDQSTTKLETTLRDKPVTAEVISTTPKINTIYQNGFKNDVSLDSLTELNSTVEITLVKKVPETNINYSIPEPVTLGSLHTTTEKTYGPITTEANIIYTTETNYLIKNNSLVEKLTTVTQPLEIITTTESPIELTHNVYQIKREINQTMITAQNNTASAINTTERFEPVFNTSSTDIINNKVIELTLLPPITMKNPVIELTTAETLQKGFTANETEVKNELHTKNALIYVDEPYVENVKNDTLLYYTNTANTINATETIKTVFNNNGSSNESSTEKQSAIKISATINLQNDFASHGIEAKNELPATNVSNSVNEPNLEKVGINTLLSVQATPAAYNVTSAPVKNKTVEDLASQSNIVANTKTGFTPEIIQLKVFDGFTSLDQATNQKVRTNPESKILGSLSQPENLVTVSLLENSSADILIKTVVHENIVGVTTYWKENENSATTPLYTLSSDVTDKTSIKSDNQDNSSVTNNVNTKDVLPETLPPWTELTSTMPTNVHTTSINVKSTKVFEKVSTNTTELLNIYSVPTTDYKTETSIWHPIDVSHNTNIENVTVIPVTTLPPQEATGQNIATVKQLITTSTTTETVGDLVSSTVTTAGYVVFNTSDLNTSNWKDSINTETVISKLVPNADVNETETINPMNGKNDINASLTVINTNKKEIIKIMADMDVVNSSVNAEPNEALKPIISNSTLSNNYIKITESQGSKAYVTATENVPDYTHLLETTELVTPNNAEAVVSLAQTNVMNKKKSTPNTLSITEKTGGTEAPLPKTVELKHIINLTETELNYVSENTNDYMSSTEAILTKLNKLPKAETQSSVSSISDYTPGSPVSHELLKTVPVYDGVTIRDSDFIMSSTEVSPKVVTENNIKISTESPLLTSRVMETQTVNYDTESSLPISELPPVPQMITEPTHTFNELAQTTTFDKINQHLLSGITTEYLPQYVTSSLNNNIPQLMASLPTEGVTAVQTTTEPTQSTDVFAQTTPVLAAAGRTNLNQGVLFGIETTDLPQNAMSTVNKNIPQSMPLLPIVGLAPARMTTEPTYITNVFSQTTPPLAVAGKTNQDVNNNLSQSIESLPFAEVAASQIRTEPTYTTTVFPHTTSLLAGAGNTSQDVPSESETTDLPQYVTIAAAYKSTQWVSDITTETITDSLTVLDSMVETIKVVEDKVSGTYLGDVMSYHPTGNNTNYSQKSVKNIIDHESIVIGSSSINNAQNTPITLVESLNINEAEIVNHTESNWLRSDVNIDSINMTETSIEEDDTKSSVSTSGTDVQNKTLVSNSSIIYKIETKDNIPSDNIEYELTTVTTNFEEVDSGAPKNVTQSKTIITKENKNAEIDSPINANIEIIDVKKYHFQVDCKNISDSYNLNNTKVNITTSHNNLSLQNSTTNNELEQHLMSRNHTITTEVQTHLNESDKQSNKTSDELTLNGISVHNPHLTSIKLNAGNNNTNAIKISALVFNCSNYTRGKYADKKDCKKFYTCIGNLKPIIGTCPNNTVFSEINKQCTRNLSHCVRNNQFRCLFEGRFSDFFKDNIYYICVKNRLHGFIRYKIQCQDGYYLNKDSVRCEKNEDISTISASSVSEMSNDESKPQPKLEKLVSKDDFECENEGKFPYVKNCSKYYVCDEIQNVYYICVKNKINGFIRYKLQCQNDYHLNKHTVKCEKNEVVSTHSSLSETNNDDSKPKSQKIVNTDDFECVNEGKFPFAKDCSKYYECTKIKNVYRRKIKICASEEVFDKKKKKCVESDSREC